MPAKQAVRIVEVRPAMGGDDAAKFAQELTRAYLRYAQRQGWSAETIDDNSKTLVLRIAGQGVERLSVEAGTHRVTRIPSNEKTGRRHTSAVTVAVLRVPETFNLIEDSNDIKVETFRGTGPGGQHRNKTESAVRVTHKPTGITATSQDDRSQHTNKERAIEVLYARLRERGTASQEHARARAKAKMHGSGHIAERQRSYLWREGVAVDHSTGVRVPLAQALDGHLAPFALCMQQLTISK